MVATNEAYEAVGGRPPHLEHEQLLNAQAETLAAARRRYSVLARILFLTLDTLYGKQRTISKFKVLELVARVPYQTWEQIAYIAHPRSQSHEAGLKDLRPGTPFPRAAGQRTVAATSRSAAMAYSRWWRKR